MTSASTENSADLPLEIPQTVKADKAAVKVWDGPVRIFHWLLVMSFIGAYVTHRLGVAYFKYHQWFGYAVVILIAFRILWGVVGTRHARFVNFIRPPAETWQYAVNLVRGRDTPTVGHNPLGALMVVVLLVTLLVQAATGLFANDEIFNAGALYGYVSNEASLQLTAIHQQLFYWIAYASGLHILAVLFHTLWKRENLVAAMVTGSKPARRFSPTLAIDSSNWGRAVTLLVLVVAALGWLIATAPSASMGFDF